MSHNILYVLCILIFFSQNAEHVLQHLDDEMLKVKKKSEQAAEYFCDNRDNFIEMVFQEIWQFTVELKKAVKVCM